MRPVLACLAALVWVLAWAPAAQSASCPWVADCRTLTVPLDRTGAVPGRVALRYALGERRSRVTAPLVMLTGGPGQAGVLFAEDWEFLFDLDSTGRTIVTLDVRGTGASGLLRCPAFERALARSDMASAGGCGASLGPRRAFYRSSDSADDLEALRRRLGVPRIAIYAVSYGTRIAVEYARRYPDRTDRVVLDSPVDDASDPFLGETFEAIPRVLRTLCRQSCPGGGAAPVADVQRLAERARATPMTVKTSRGRVRIDEDALLNTLVTGDLDPDELMRPFPGAVRAALAGRPGALARLVRTAELLNGPDTVEAFSPALFAATICEEAPVAWDRAAAPAERRAQALTALAARPAAAFSPFTSTAALNFSWLSLCGDWPAPTRQLGPEPPAPTPVPVLILSGDLDVRTPREGARRLAARLGNATVVSAPTAGHDVFGAALGSCATRSVAAFLRGRLPACARPPGSRRR